MTCLRMKLVGVNKGTENRKLYMVMVLSTYVHQFIIEVLRCKYTPKYHKIGAMCMM